MRRYVETRRPKRIDAALTQRGQVVPPGRDELRFTLPYFFVDHDAGADVSADHEAFLAFFTALLIDSIFVLHLSARRRDIDHVALLAAHERAAERGLIREPRVLGIGLGRTDDRKFMRIARPGLFDPHGRTEMDFVRNVVALIDDARVANHPFELENASFDERLLLLGVLVFGIFGDVAELFRLTNSFVDFSAMNGLELVELFLELL